MRILVSNDDGYRAEGLQRLADALRPLAEVTVVAPDRNRSGASNSLTLDVPVRVTVPRRNALPWMLDAEGKLRAGLEAEYALG